MFILLTLCEFTAGDFQREYLKKGKIFSIDVGENNLATTSNGIIHGGGKLRHERDLFLAGRAKL